MALTFSFGDDPERIRAADVQARVPEGTNPFEVTRIRSQLRVAECREHHRAPRAVHVRMVGSRPELTAAHDCGIEDAECPALDAELRRLVAVPQP